MKKNLIGLIFLEGLRDGPRKLGNIEKDEWL
jgi:hypothetical protein